MVDMSCVFEHWTVSILARVDEQEVWAEDSVQVHSLREEDDNTRYALALPRSQMLMNEGSLFPDLWSSSLHEQYSIAPFRRSR